YYLRFFAIIALYIFSLLLSTLMDHTSKNFFSQVLVFIPTDTTTGYTNILIWLLNQMELPTTQFPT
ncbi:MAG: hypothetical protein MUP39_04105, partial [Wolbachia endosymbiont of Homalodisca vitripennis]|nr:hypothetical protein [Wolbachia endosymbiont of Homalodisca vitripennis]